MTKFLTASEIIVGDYIFSKNKSLRVLKVENGTMIVLYLSDGSKEEFFCTDKIGVDDYGNTDD